MVLITYCIKWAVVQVIRQKWRPKYHSFCYANRYHFPCFEYFKPFEIFKTGVKIQIFKTGALVYKLADHFCEHLCIVEKKNYTHTSKPGTCHFNFPNHFIHNMTFSFDILLRWKFAAYQLLCLTNLLATTGP